MHLSVDQVKKLVVAAEQKKVLEEKVSVLNQRISELENIIVDLKSKDSNNGAIVQNYITELAINKEQRAIWEKEISDLQDALKQQKKKTFWTSVGGVAVAVLLIYLTK